uniref:Ig-like domain repeat protein n=1 Tax=Nevskia soli TaxID=418856 RepID=UPI0015D7C334
MNLKRLIFTLLLGSAFAAAQPVPPTVPAAYQSLYSELQADISSFVQSMPTPANGSSNSTIYSAQLLTATSNQGPSLLGANYYTSIVLPELQELQALGVTAVTVHINFPILYQPYYSNPQDFQNYVSFYQRLAQQIHANGLKMTVETTVASAGAGSNGGIYAPYYATLSWNDYIAGRAQNAVNVAKLIQPDFMSVITEPDSESQNSGQPTAGTPAGSLQELQTILAALQAANVTNVPVGAGAGTWINSFTTYIQNVLSTPISYVDVHMYSVSNSFPENALTAAAMAQAAGLPIAMGETWCKKISAAQLASQTGELNNESVDAQGMFSFWEPLDQMYLQALVDMAQAGQFLFIAPFWTSEFFAYLDYGQYGSQTPDQIMSAITVAAGSARQIGAFTPVGQTWETLILPAPDTSAPQVPGPPSIGAVGQNIVQVLWNPTTDNVGVAGYYLFRNGTLLYTSSQVNYDDNSVVPSTTYSYQLQAFDAAGNVSAMSAPASATTLAIPDQTPPSTPTGLAGVGLSDLSVGLSWQPSTDNNGVAGYHIYRGVSATALNIYATSTTASFTDSNNTYPKTTYYYAVTAFDSSGNVSVQSAAIAVTTLPDTTPPSAPASLTAVAQGPQQVGLSWSPSTDDVNVSGYSISRGKTPSTMIAVGNTSATSFVDTAGLSAAQTYYYIVQAYDEAANYSAASPMATVTTPPVTTPPTVSLQTSVSPSNIGQSVTFTATVRLTSGTIPNGETVSFSDGATQIGSGTTNGGIATFSTGSLAPGSHSVFATYPGDGTYQGATSAAVNQVVLKNSTATVVTSSLNPATYGQSVTFTALVSSSGTLPTGSVTFKNGATTIGSSTLVNGAAAFSTTTLATGTNSITAFYGGDASSLTSTSAAINQVVNDAVITLAVQSGTNPSTLNEQVTFTAILTVPNGGSPTGTVTFSQNGQVIGSPAVVASQRASVSTSFSAPGTYSITAVYSGDANFAPAGTSQALSQTVTSGSTTISVVSSGSPANPGSPVTFTATIKSSEAVMVRARLLTRDIVHFSSGTVPNGETVTFKDGTLVIGSGVTASGIATFTTSSLAVGTHSITASYSGDTEYSASTSTPISQTISKNTTTTSITSNLNPSSYEQPVTFTATVSSPGVTPTGTVTFENGSKAIGSGTLTNGVATFTTVNLATGTSSIIAVYEGDASSLTSTSPALNQMVNDAAITIALRSSASAPPINQQVTFTATLTVPNGGTPTGTVTFSQNGHVIGSPAAVASRQASISTSFSAPGTYSITAVYSGDANFSSATSPALSQTVNTASTTTTITTSGSPASVGTPVTFTATIHPASGSIPNGETVTFKGGTTVLGSGVTASGIATFTTSSLAVGTQSITASYGGDTDYSASTSAPISQTISKNTTTTTVTSNLNPSSYEQSITLTATVTSPGATPTGTVTFENGSTPIGSGTLANGVATLSTANLATGTSSITAVYGGDASSLNSTSPALNQVVNHASITIALRSSASAPPINQQVTFTATLTVPNGGNPTGTVTFSQNGHVIGSPAAVASRQASISTSFSAPGTYSIT